MVNSEYRSFLLKVLNEFHFFCEENNLQYYLIGGGLIGTLRHGGFIPWDDDIDVAMPRADYDRFISLRNTVGNKYSVLVPNIDTKYGNTMTRMFSKEYKVRENFLKSFTIGPWIDIFPLDNTFDNRFLRLLHFRSVYLVKILLASKLGGVNVEGNAKAKVKLLLFYMLKVVPRSSLFWLFKKLIQLKKKPAYYCGNLMGRWREKEIIPAEELKYRKLYPFSGIEVYSFKNHDEWLVRVYGDYMQLPKKEDRVPDHNVNIIE